MVNNRVIEYVFFFVLLAASAILVWRLFAPFGGALILAAIIVTVCYPLYERMVRIVPRNNSTLAALFSVLTVFVVVVLPLAVLASFILREALSVYSLLNTAGYASYTALITSAETFIRTFIPGFTLDISSFVQQVAGFIATHLVGLFTGTASTIFLFFIALIASFYFFRDGKAFTGYLVKMSPLKDMQDELILSRLARSVRSVAIGTIFISLIQGTLTAIGLSLFGFERAILWGCVAGIGALIPGIGTTIVFVPAVIYLIFTSSYGLAVAVSVWGVLAVGLIDNVIGPYVMSRGNSLHPFLILLAVLGGIALFGPLGFILGPVILSLFSVLLELYATHTRKSAD